MLGGPRKVLCGSDTAESEAGGEKNRWKPRPRQIHCQLSQHEPHCVTDDKYSQPIKCAAAACRSPASTYQLRLRSPCVLVGKYNRGR